MLLFAFIRFYMLLLDKLSEQEEEEEMLLLCLTDFYLLKPAKISKKMTFQPINFQ